MLSPLNATPSCISKVRVLVRAVSEKFFQLLDVPHVYLTTIEPVVANYTLQSPVAIPDYLVQTFREVV